MMAIPVQSLHAFQHYQFAPVQQGAALSSLPSSAAGTFRNASTIGRMSG